ncbi:hypothetical protein BKI52_18185 [marine bacterium AO1-C]|nr:hypothetical protein BKI52_18185 [marine bacterium AO1-C]
MRFLSLQAYSNGLQKLLTTPLSFFSPQKFRWQHILLAIIFPASFFLIFKPFGIFNPSGGLLQNMVVAGYGIVSGVMAFLFFIVFPAFAKHFFDSFNVGKAIVYFLIFFLLLAAANYVYKTSWCGDGHYSWCGFLVVFKRTILIGILPLILLIVWEKNKALKAHITVSHPIQSSQVSPLQEWIIYADNRKEMVKLSLDNFLFVESADNYIEIHSTLNGHPEKKLIRTTLGKVETTIAASSIIRCHRSFIVNLQKVIHATGNSRGLLLELQGCPQKIPVSRRYVPIVTDKLNLS